MRWFRNEKQMLPRRGVADVHRLRRFSFLRHHVLFLACGPRPRVCGPKAIRTPGGLQKRTRALIIIAAWIGINAALLAVLLLFVARRCPDCFSVIC